MNLTKYERDALDGKKGEALELAYRILVATGEATSADNLTPITWAHISGVNYNTIGDAGKDFLSKFSETAKVNVMTTTNPTGFDIDNIDTYDLDDEFIIKQQDINNAYKKIGAIQSFSCIPYELFDTTKNTQVAFAESNAAIHANSEDDLQTNKESAFSALASAITGKSINTDIRKNMDHAKLSITTKLENQNELTCGLLGFFAGDISSCSVININGLYKQNISETKSLCSGLGTSSQCIKYTLNKQCGNIEKITFDKNDLHVIYDKLNTADRGDIIVLGSPQLGLSELINLSNMLKNKKFKKKCMIFCPRLIKNTIKQQGYLDKLQNAGCEIHADCCICFTPLLTNKKIDSVITNSVKGAYYLKKENKITSNLKPLSQILQDETI